MTTAFPSALDAYADPPGGVTQGVTTPTHSGHHTNHNDAVEALEAKLGIGSSVAAANTVLTGTGAGQTAYGQVATAMLATTAVSQQAGATATAAQTTTATSPALILGSQVPLTCAGTGFVLVTATGTVRHSVANELVLMYGYVDSTNMGQYTLAQVPTAGGFAAFSFALTIAVAAGSHTFSLQWAVNAGTATLQAAAISVAEFKK